MKKIIFISLFAVILTPLLAQTGEVFTTSEGAIGGYDAVAYFKQGKPVKGKKNILIPGAEHSGCLLRKKTKRHLRLHLKNMHLNMEAIARTELRKDTKHLHNPMPGAL